MERLSFKFAISDTFLESPQEEPITKTISDTTTFKVDYVVNRLLVIFSALPATNEYCSYVDVRRYADKNVLSSFANITEAIGPAPQYEFINIMSCKF